MTESELYVLQCVKSGWKCFAVILCFVIGFSLTIMISQRITETNIIHKIEQSVYNVSHIHSLTNDYYIIEKKN